MLFWKVAPPVDAGRGANRTLRIGLRTLRAGPGSGLGAAMGGLDGAGGVATLRDGSGMMAFVSVRWDGGLAIEVRMLVIRRRAS